MLTADQQKWINHLSDKKKIEFINEILKKAKKLL